MKYLVSYAIFLACLCATQVFAEKETTIDLYNSLDDAQNYAVCAVAANIYTPKDKILSGQYLIKFREIKKVPSVVPDSLLLELGENWIKKNGYLDLMEEVYSHCAKDAT